jgi:hypothetical protein
MDAIERAAHLSVGRACGFCGLAILCFMVGFSSDPYLAARVGGSFALAVSLVLIVKAGLASRVPYKRTETWLILDTESKPPQHAAQAMIATVLRRVYLYYAWISAAVATLLLVASVLFGIAFG